MNPVEIKTIAGVKPATDPTPKNGATVSTTDVRLEWWQGSNVAYANGHHLYFSDQMADVNTGDAKADKGLTTDPNYLVAGLVPGATYYWRIDEVNDVHPDKLWRGDVWSFTVASAKAAVPNPPDSAQYVNRNRVLSWAPGTSAVSHRVYFGTDPGAVQNATPDIPLGVYQGRQADASFTPLQALQWGQTYYWRIDEVHEGLAGSPWKGAVWSFTVANFLVVDDFESYNDDNNRIYDTWIDGLTNNNGSQVGYLTAPFAEQTIIHGGRQSMPFDYNNAKSPFFSEAQREWTAPQDWTINGLSDLVVWLRGNPASFVATGPGAMTMSAWGTDIYNTADQCRFAYKSLTGNGTIIARVDNIGNSDPWAKGGVMIRESLDAGSRFAIVFASSGNGVRFQARALTDNAATSDTPVATAEQIALQTPVWVKLERIRQYLQRLLLHGRRQVDGNVLEPADDQHGRSYRLHRLGIDQSQCDCADDRLLLRHHHDRQRLRRPVAGGEDRGRASRQRPGESLRRGGGQCRQDRRGCQPRSGGRADDHLDRVEDAAE